MKTSIKRFNPQGIERFRTFLENARHGEIDPFPEEILDSPYHTNGIRTIDIIESKIFDSKADLIKYIHSLVANLDKIQFNDTGLWTWLAAFFFESICPIKNDKRKVQEDSKYILNVEHWGRYYRHLIAAPLRLFNELGELSKIYLVGVPAKHGDFMEQLASRQELATSFGIVEVATFLYWDEDKENIKRGARNKTGPGVLRRLTRDIIPQFQMTYDLNSMNGQEILELLPSEFDSWKK